MPWALHLSQGQKETLAESDAQPVRGLHRIDEALMKSLSGEELTSLAQSGALSLAYPQLFSEQRMAHLSRRYQLHSEWHRHLANNDSLDVLFAEDDDDTLEFDFGE